MPDARQLYDQDFNLWAQETAAALRTHRFADIDVEHVAEEIEDMGKRNARELKSRITHILEHELKRRLAKGVLFEYNQGLWQASILRQRTEIEGLFVESPSLSRLIHPEFIEDCYQDAAAAVAAEYRVELPAKCPFAVADVL